MPAGVVGGQPQRVPGRRADERERQHLDEARLGQCDRHRAAPPLPGREAPARRRGRQLRRDRGVALQPQHLFDEVGGLRQVRPPRRRRRDDLAAPVGARAEVDRAPHLTEATRRHARRVRHARHAVGQVQRHPHRHGRRGRPYVGTPARDRPTAELDQQRGDPLGRHRRQLRIDRALEPARRLAGQLVTACAARDRRRVEVGRLDDDVDRLAARPDLRRRTAHHAREPDGARVVGDEEVVGIEVALDVVEGGEGLPQRRPPHDDRTRQPRGVVGVQGLAQLQHHVVRDVHDQRDRPHARSEQPSLHPPRRRRLRVDAVHAAGDEAQAALVGEGDRPSVALGGRHDDAARRVDVVDVGGDRDLAGQPAHGERVAAVRRDVELDHRVVRAEQRERVVARLGGVRGQHEDARVVGADAELAHRGDHAVGHAPVGLARGDLEAAREHRARERGDHEVTDGEVGGPADHAARGVLADVDLAPPDRLLEAGELLDPQHPADLHRPGDLRGGVDLLDLEPHAHERLGGGVDRRQVGDVLGQPGLQDPHG